MDKYKKINKQTSEDVWKKKYDNKIFKKKLICLFLIFHYSN